MTSAAARFMRPQAAVCGAMLVGLLLAAGCGTSSLDLARGQFYSGRFDAADQTLSKESDGGIDRVLLLMERGTIRQAAGRYEPSARDFDKANTEIEDMTSISVSKDTGSMVINDTIQDYRGEHFERTLLHALDANNYLALGRWDDAAVEARRITKSLEPDVRGEFPEDAYSRYVAGLCFELANDPSAAAFQYRRANAVARGPAIEEQTGRLSASSNQPPAAAAAGDTDELVCLIALGRSPTGDELLRRYKGFSRPPFAEVVFNGRVLGRSHNLADVADLAFITAEKQAFRKAAKAVARIATKEIISHQLEQQDELVGALARLILIGFLEQPDTRRWETLPRWLQVARVPCPPDLQEFDIVFRDANGHETGRQHISRPLQQRGHLRVTFCRDLTPRP